VDGTRQHSALVPGLTQARAANPWHTASAAAAAAAAAAAESLEGDRPVLFFCKAGKDRTGLLAAMLLQLLGASECGTARRGSLCVALRAHAVCLPATPTTPP
jgi:hypothetical protein